MVYKGYINLMDLSDNQLAGEGGAIQMNGDKVHAGCELIRIQVDELLAGREFPLVEGCDLLA